jgi:hypothetical protein
LRIYPSSQSELRRADLVQSLIEARDEWRLTALQQRYQKVALLVRIKPESLTLFIST